MKLMLGSILIMTAITISMVNGQYDSRFIYNHGQIEDSDRQMPAEEANTRMSVRLLDEPQPIPLSLLQEMSNVTDLNDFITRFVVPDGIDPSLGIQQKDGYGGVERGVSRQPIHAKCIPEDKVVALEPLNRSTDPSTIYYPQCTRVKRCGGCCASLLLACQPVEVETITFKIMKVQYVANKKGMAIVGQEPVLVEEHKRCNCSCRIKKENCNSKQVYDPSQCQCYCKDYDARKKCLDDDKIWDHEKCECRCLETQQCTTGTYFDEQLCKCVQVYGYEGNSTTALLNRRRFIVKAIPVKPSNETIYDTEN